MRSLNTPKIRLVLLSILGAYPIMTAYFYLLSPLISGWQNWQRTLILAPLMVSTLMLVLVPAIQKHLGKIISGGQQN